MNGAKKILRSLGFSVLFVLPSAIVLGQGCTIGKEVCDLQCDCTKCSDRAFDDCVDQTNAAVDTADAYDCRAEFDAYKDCYVDNFKCDEELNVPEGPDADDCADEQQDLGECMADASDHGSGSGPSQQGSTTTTTASTTTGGGAACAAYVDLCVSCGLGDQTACEGSVAGADDAACQTAYDQLVAAGC